MVMVLAPWRRPPDQVSVGRTQDADVVDSRMLVKALVFRSDDGVLELRRHFVDRYNGAPLLAEFADERALRRVDAKRNLRLVRGQRAELREVRVGKNDKQSKDEDGGRHRAREQGRRKAKKPKPHWEVGPSPAAHAGARRGVDHSALISSIN